MDSELKPCPFCDAELIKYSEGRGYYHPKGNCVLAEFEMLADGYSEERWNTGTPPGDKGRESPAEDASTGEASDVLVEELTDAIIAAIKADCVDYDGVCYAHGDNGKHSHGDGAAMEVDGEFDPSAVARAILPIITRELFNRRCAVELEHLAEMERVTTAAHARGVAEERAAVPHRPIMLEMAEADERHHMWERRWKTLPDIYPIERIFADRYGRWGLRDFIAYAGEACGFSPAQHQPAQREGEE